MAMVSERMNPKPAGSSNDPRVRGTSNSTLAASPLVPENKDEGGFFTSFWSSNKKKKPGVLEPVSRVSTAIFIILSASTRLES